MQPSRIRRLVHTALPGLLFALWLPVVGAAAATEMTPVERIRHTTETLLSQVDRKRDQIAANPEYLYALVEAVLLPQVDFDRMARWILGRNWRKANAQERKAFVANFRNMLVRTYSSAILGFTDIQVEYLPLRQTADSRKVVVQTRIQHNNAPSVGISYRMYERNGRWLIYDVTVEGISLVTTLRKTVSAEIRRLGLAGFLSDLEARSVRLIERDRALASRVEVGQ